MGGMGWDGVMEMGMGRGRRLSHVDTGGERPRVMGGVVEGKWRVWMYSVV